MSEAMCCAPRTTAARAIPARLRCPPRAVVRAMFVLALAAAPALARAGSPEDAAGASGEEAPASVHAYRYHHLVFDATWFCATAGLIGGIVDGRCRDEGFSANVLAGHTFMGAFFGIFMGASWGGEDPGAAFHPPDPVRDLKAFRIRSRKGDSLEIHTYAGDVVLAKLDRYRPGELTVKVAGRREVIPDSEICAIATLRDPPWDGLMWGAACGAVYGFLYADRTPKAEGVSVSSMSMAALGAAIMGAAGLYADLYHNGRNVLLDRGRCPPARVAVGPCITQDGGGVAVSLRF